MERGRPGPRPGGVGTIHRTAPSVRWRPRPCVRMLPPRGAVGFRSVFNREARGAQGRLPGQAGSGSNASPLPGRVTLDAFPPRLWNRVYAARPEGSSAWGLCSRVSCESIGPGGPDPELTRTRPQAGAESRQKPAGTTQTAADRHPRSARVPPPLRAPPHSGNGRLGRSPRFGSTVSRSETWPPTPRGLRENEGTQPESALPPGGPPGFPAGADQPRDPAAVSPHAHAHGVLGQGWPAPGLGARRLATVS